MNDEERYRQMQEKDRKRQRDAIAFLVVFIAVVIAAVIWQIVDVLT